MASMTKRMEALKSALGPDDQDSMLAESVMPGAQGKSGILKMDMRFRSNDPTMGLVCDLKAWVQLLDDQLQQERLARQDLKKEMEAALLAVLGVVGEVPTKRKSSNSDLIRAEVLSAITSELEAKDVVSQEQV